jgi:hypothetical protein
MVCPLMGEIQAFRYFWPEGQRQRKLAQLSLRRRWLAAIRSRPDRLTDVKPVRPSRPSPFRVERETTENLNVLSPRHLPFRNLLDVAPNVAPSRSGGIRRLDHDHLTF